jgi:hypothetical protein
MGQTWRIPGSYENAALIDPLCGAVKTAVGKYADWRQVAWAALT